MADNIVHYAYLYTKSHGGMSKKVRKRVTMCSTDNKNEEERRKRKKFVTVKEISSTTAAVHKEKHQMDTGARKCVRVGSPGVQ